MPIFGKRSSIGGITGVSIQGIDRALVAKLITFHLLLQTSGTLLMEDGSKFTLQDTGTNYVMTANGNLLLAADGATFLARQNA